MTRAQIEAFLEICRMRNITRAAEALYISQSSLSTRIKTLEQEIGCQLLSRGKGLHEVELTMEGEQFYQLAVQYKEILEKMRMLGRPTEKNIFRVSSINSLGGYLLPAVYELFMEQNSEIELEIQDMETPSAVRSLELGNTDLAFGTSDVSGAGVESFPAVAEKMMLICSRDADYPEVVSRRDLPVHQELFNVWSIDFIHWHDEIFGRRAQPAVRLAIMDQIEFFLAKSGRWAFVPYSVGRTLLADGNFRSCRTDFSVPDRVIYCLCQAGRRAELPVGNFLSCLKENIENLDPEGEYIQILF